MISYQKPKRFCCEDIAKIENYEQAIADDNHTWECHHRAEILPCGRYSVKDLEAVGMYWNRPASELIFLRQDVHRSLHHKGKTAWNKGRPRSEETKRRIAKSNPRRKMVEMTRLSDGFTMTFPSQHEAVRWLRLNGYPQASAIWVSRCARGHRATYNATWRYL